MKEEFVNRIYKTVIEDGEKIYKELYENTEVTRFLHFTIKTNSAAPSYIQ